MEGIVYENTENGWQCTQDRWPAGAKEAQLQYANQPPFGNYTKEEAVGLLVHTITKGTPHYSRYAVVPVGFASKRRLLKKENEMTDETKEAVLGVATLSGAAAELPDADFGIESAEASLPARETAVLKTRKPRTKVNLEQAKTLFAEGKSVAEIAEAQGTSYMAIRVALINAKILTPKTRAPKEG